MQPFLSVSSVYDSPCMTWTVYWTLNLRRLPTLIISALFTGYPECLPPAPIISLNSDSDSALPTLCLKLVFEFCLSDLHFVLLKPHMDPHASDSALHHRHQTRKCILKDPDQKVYLERSRPESVSCHAYRPVLGINIQTHFT